MNLIEERMQISDSISVARSRSKPNKCILCGKTKTSFCNSHSIPQMSLKAIAEDGKLLLASFLMGKEVSEVFDFERGVKNSGTFHFICNECDAKYFRDYENLDNLLKMPTDKMLAEIALKNFLLHFKKKSFEIELYNYIQEKSHIYNNLDNFQKINKKDLDEYENEYLMHKKIVEENETNCYQILFHRILNYKVPIAIQSIIGLAKDMYGGVVNDFEKNNANKRVQYMHICIFPLMNGQSVILAFYHKKDKLYKKLWHQFNSNSYEKGLGFINYLVFAYTENYFISKKVESKLNSCQKLKQLSLEQNEKPNLGMLGPFNCYGNYYNPVRVEEIPNLLNFDWAI